MNSLLGPICLLKQFDIYELINIRKKHNCYVHTFLASYCYMRKELLLVYTCRIQPGQNRFVLNNQMFFSPILE